MTRHRVLEMWQQATRCKSISHNIEAQRRERAELNFNNGHIYLILCDVFYQRSTLAHRNVMCVAGNRDFRNMMVMLFDDATLHENATPLYEFNVSEKL